VINSKGQFVKGSVPFNKGVPCPDWIKQRISQANKGRTAWNKTNIFLNCVVCGKKFRTIPSKIKRVCGIVCRNKYYKKCGKDHHSYKNGISLYRNHVKIEKCDNCDSTKFLLVHHIDFDRTNNDIKNLKVLCKSCHQTTHDAFLNFSSS
jgi:hypothetical protein